MKTDLQRDDWPAISIVIPTLNEAANIGALLDSLLAQNYAGAVQILVCDGDSADETLSIVQSYSQKSTQVLAEICKRGVSHQRNVGAQSASGELLVFMDADDRVPENFLHDVAISFRRWRWTVACPWLVAREENWAIRGAYCSFNVLFWLGQSWLKMGSGVCIIVRREVFERIGGFDESLHLGEDIHLIRRAARHGWHRHLTVPLHTSGRRYQSEGWWKLSLFYARITPLLLLGIWQPLRKIRYQAAPYKR